MEKKSDYRKAGYVSIWVGNFPVVMALRGYVRIDYEEDEPSSMFQEDFHLGRYTPELREFEFYENPPLEAVNFLKGASYSTSFIDAFTEKFAAFEAEKPNAVILLFDFQFPFEQRIPILAETNWIASLGSFRYNRQSRPI
ncbi:MAG: immunity 22 family protein [Bacteroidetes bacterium]|nr:immunity 22 family protein [Bacteroidota bacterium]